MERLITYNFTEDTIAKLAGLLKEDYLKAGNDLSKVAIVFGGKRPSLFLKKELSKLLGASFYPPKFFSIDEFVSYTVSKNYPPKLIEELNASYMIYNIILDNFKHLLKRREGFCEFLSWAREIANFINELDLESIGPEIPGIEDSDKINIPDNIFALLKDIFKIRDIYHGKLKDRSLYSRGLIYAEASKVVREVSFEEFDKIFFCDFYSLHKTEEHILKSLYDSGKAVLIFQRDESGWPVFEKLSKIFGSKIAPGQKDSQKYQFELFKGFDRMSQVGLAGKILKEKVIAENRSLDKTLIMLPDPDTFIPLISEVSGLVEALNVSIGYPLKRSSFYALLKHIFTAQETKKDNLYYTKDYLRVILHPLMKNLSLAGEGMTTRVLVHKLEELFKGIEKSALSGAIFLDLDDLGNIDEISEIISEALEKAQSPKSKDDIRRILEEIHEIGFKKWEKIKNFNEFIAILNDFCQVVLEKGLVEKHYLDLKIVERIFEIINELKVAEFAEEGFAKVDIFRIFLSKLDSEMISFKGDPLKGIQIMGLFETRSLQFDNVIIMDLNEGVIPNVSGSEPLIPKALLEAIGINRLNQDEDIQRYYFMRLIKGAKNAYLIYDDNPDKERSRLLEEIIWQEEKLNKRPGIIQASRAKFDISGVIIPKETIKKNQKIIDYLKNDLEYSSSSIDTYLSCPLKFYYQYVLRLREKENLLDEAENKDIGNFVHELLENTFSCFKGKRPLLDSKFVESFYREFEELFKNSLEKRMGEEAFMVKDILKSALDKFLKSEKKRNPEKILFMEEKRTKEIMRLNDKTLKFTWRADRIDLVNEKDILVIDYKTGSTSKFPKDLKKLENNTLNRNLIFETIHSFQLPIYCYFVKRDFPDHNINAALYDIKSADLIYFIDDGSDSYQDKMNLCFDSLDFVISELWDPKINFETCDTPESYCDNCPFSSMCG